MNRCARLLRATRGIAQRGVLLLLIAGTGGAIATSAGAETTAETAHRTRTWMLAQAAPAVPSAMAQFTSGVENREPIDQLTFVESTTEKIFFFSDLRGFEGQTVVHRWSFKGETQAEVSFAVGGPRWRVWSSKDLSQALFGDWTVEIVNEAGEVVAAETFTYRQPDA